MRQHFSTLITQTITLSSIALVGACASQETPVAQAPYAVHHNIESGPLLAFVAAPAASQASPSRDDSHTQKIQAAPISPATAPSPDLEPVVEPVVTPMLETVRIGRTTRVFAEPSTKSAVLGVITRGTNTAVAERKKSDTCKAGWLRLAPRGWVCTSSEPTTDALTTTAMPRLDRRRAVPGTAGRIRAKRLVYANRAAVLAGDGTPAGGRRVRMAGTEHIGGRVFWRTQQGELVAARDVARSKGSSFEGVFLTEDTELRLPVAFAHAPRARGARVVVLDRPNGRRVDSLEPREAVNVQGASKNGRWLQIGVDRWIAASHARVAELATPPETVGAADMWLDFDRDTQVVVVYRGARPLYATLSSSGKWRHRTPVGVYRVEKKIAKTTMSSRPDAKEPYEVKNVPWTLFFHYGYAVHGAYWHNKFGTPVSHGCLNLAPTDAKVVYEMLGPEVPAGWSVVIATDEDPGAIVRIKTKKSPTPPLRGSAATYAARQKKNADTRPDMVATR